MLGRFGEIPADFGAFCIYRCDKAESKILGETPWFDNRWSLPKFANEIYDTSMTTMNISLPDSLKEFVDEQVEQRGYGTSSEYVRELIRKEQDRLQLRELLLEGASSAPTRPVDDAYFDGLRRRVKVSKSGSRR
jgi:antitoxin ParD1/3/4